MSIPRWGGPRGIKQACVYQTRRGVGKKGSLMVYNFTQVNSPAERPWIRLLCE
jgi:hypothetical protein